MRFSLTASTPDSAPNGRLASPAAGLDIESSTPIVAEIPPPDIIIDPFPLFTYEQVELRDAAGNLIGLRETTSGPGFSSVSEYDVNYNLTRSEYRDSSGYFGFTEQTLTYGADGALARIEEQSRGGGLDHSYRSQSVYDGNYNLISSDFSDSFGYRSIARRIEEIDAAGRITGYRLDSSGGDANGYAYTSVESFDADYNLLRSDYSDSSGYRSVYIQETQTDSSGAVTGYVTRYEWSDGIATYTSVDRFDADWNYLDGDSSKPDIVIDDGPAVLPAVTGEATTLARTAIDAAIVPLAANGDGAAEAEVRTLDAPVDLRQAKHKGMEHATLLGSADLSISGDSGENRLSGNAGDNRLDGRKGDDVLFGGLGDDVFVIRGGRTAGVDTLTDFGSGEDHIALQGRQLRKLFDHDGALREGTLGDRLFYDASSGELRFDRDGANGKVASVVLAVLVGVGDLDTDDFMTG